jgi:S1-C subfamily serine protease
VVGLTTSGSATAQGRESRRVQIVGASGSHLGVNLTDVTAADLARLKLGEERGAVVKDVDEGSPAAKAGLKPGDVILRYQGQDVSSVAQLVRLVRETPPGRKVTIEVSRDGQSQKLAATLEEGHQGLVRQLLATDDDLPLPQVAPLPQGLLGPHGAHRGLLLRDMLFDRGARKLGIEYQEVSGQLARYFKLDDRGVLVTEVEPDGPADKAGLKAGDVLLKVDARDVADGEELREALGRLEPGTETTLAVKRDGTGLELKIKLGGRRPDAKRSGDET